MMNDIFEVKNIKSFSFDKETSDEEIKEMCASMGVPVNEASRLIEIRDTYAK